MLRVLVSFTDRDRAHRVGTSWLAFALAVVCMTTASSLAAPASLTDDEKKKIDCAIDLLEGAYSRCADMELADLEGPSGASPSPVGYDDIRIPPYVPRPATFGDVAKQLRGMLAKDKIRSDTLKSANAQAHWKDGLDDDEIIINTKILAKLCDPAATGVEKMCALLQLVASLANEAAHVFQTVPVYNSQTGCDAERDSDAFSWKALSAIYAALTSDQPGPTMPNTSTFDVLVDSGYTAWLYTKLSMFGVSSAADLAKVHKCAEMLYAHYANRWHIFGLFITAPASWYDWYNPSKKGAKDVTPGDDMFTRAGTIITSSDESLSRTFPVPAASLITSTATISADGRQLLAVLHGPAGSQPTLTLWRDDTDDAVPEAAAISNIVLPAFPPATRGLYSMGIHPFESGELPINTADSGFVITDRVLGRAIIVRLDTSGGVLGSSILFSSSMINAANKPSLIDILSRPGGVHRFVFTAGTIADFDVIWFDINATGMVVGTQLSPGIRLAQARSPDASPGPELASAGFAGPVVLNGNPFSVLTLLSVGRGANQFITSGSTGSNGRTAALPIPALAGNDLLRTDDTLFGQTAVSFIPRVGRTIDLAIADETNDLLPDRVQVSADPPRLHLLRSVDGLGIFQHEYEIALERADIGGFESWTPLERSMRIPDATVALHRIDSIVLPMFAQSLRDFEGDGLADDAVVIVRQGEFGAWAMHYFTVATIPGGGLFQGSFILPPPPFEPAAVVYPDLNGDARPDVRIIDAMGGPPACFITTPSLFPWQRFNPAVCEGVLTVAPDPPSAGQPVTISYDPAGRPLAGLEPLFLHFAINNGAWTAAPDALMAWDPAMLRWAITVIIPVVATQIDLSFTDGSMRWDRNGVIGWHLPVIGAPPPCPGDANGDRVINFMDVTTVLAAFGQSGPPYRPGDGDGDGQVTFADITSALSNWGMPCL